MDKMIPINPWLEKQITLLRETLANEALREEYSLLPSEDISWQDFIEYRSLQLALDRDSFLKTHRMELGLSNKVEQTLNALGVDYAADLFQFTEDELLVFLDRNDIGEIASLFHRNGQQLFSNPVRTYKISTDAVLEKNWIRIRLVRTITVPSSLTPFDIGRPSSADWWFEKYYARYEYTLGEERLLSAPIRDYLEIDSGEMHYEYKEFFSALGNFWRAYDEVCRMHDIHPIVPRPSYPLDLRDMYTFTNDRFISLKKQSIRALLSVLERTPRIGTTPVEKYLRAPDTIKLDIMEEISEDDSLQALLISHVEMRIDLENLIVYFNGIFR